jgi:hypothetical protein
MTDLPATERLRRVVLADGAPLCEEKGPVGGLPATGPTRPIQLLDDAIEITEKSDGVVVVRITRTKQQRDPAATDRARQGCYRGLFVVEFLMVSLSELRPSRWRWIVVEPSSECYTRRDILEPEVDCRSRLGQAPRPQTVDEHPDPVFFRRRIVDAFHLKRFAIGFSLHDRER